MFGTKHLKKIGSATPQYYICNIYGLLGPHALKSITFHAVVM
uniref:Uncharacterized protein n=1 Tax=Anguilla anguilla TaxID=7936 RepID=A0A0E9TEF3_ANGAN